MKISCSQFENLLSFYLNDDLSESLTEAVEEHLRECPLCSAKYDVLHTIIGEIKDAYNKFINNDSSDTDYKDIYKEDDNFDIETESPLGTELSAYMDNELPEEHSVRVRRNIIAKPKIRKKLEKMYELRKMMINSFSEQKNKLKTDYSKEIVKSINTDISGNQIYLHCIAFIFVVIFASAISIWAILNLL